MSSLDYLDLCRLCLVKDRVSVPIFEDEGDVRQIFLKITACLPVKVSRDDKLPKKICDDCVYKVELFYQFWNTTASAEKQLLQWLGEVGGLEDKQGYVTEVLDTNVMKQERNSDNRLDGSVLQVSGHQNSMDMGMMDNISLITMPAGNEQQFAPVPIDTSGTVQTVQAVPGPSTQNTHDAMTQSQTSVSHLVEEEEESEEDENSDDGCDNEEGLPVKEETEDDQTDRPLEPTTFVSLPCDEAGPSGLQQQKISEISEMTMSQTTDGDPKTGFEEDSKQDVRNIVSNLISEIKIENIFTYQDYAKVELNEDIKRFPKFYTIFLNSHTSSYSRFSTTFKRKNPFHGTKRKRLRKCKDPLNLSNDDKENLQIHKSRSPSVLPAKIKQEFEVPLPMLFCEMPSPTECFTELKIKQENEKRYSERARRRNLRNKFMVHNQMTMRKFINWYPCGECSMKFQCGRLLVNHVIKDHPYFYCSRCREYVRNKYLLKTHLQNHMKNLKAPFKCDECNFTYKSIYSLLNHKETHISYKLPAKLVLSHEVKIDNNDDDLFNDASSTSSIVEFDDDYDRLS